MCFSLEFLKQILIMIVVFGAIVAILGLLIPFVVSKMGLVLGEGWSLLVRIFKIFIWAIVIIIVITVAFEFISCLWSFVGGSILPHR